LLARLKLLQKASDKKSSGFIVCVKFKSKKKSKLLRTPIFYVYTVYVIVSKPLNLAEIIIDIQIQFSNSINL
jgi:hypothetical protein